LSKKTPGDGPLSPEPESDEESDVASPPGEAEPHPEPSSLAEALQPSPEGEVDPFLQRARLAEDRLGEVLGAYRKLKVDNEGHRQRITRNIERRYDQRRERLLVKFIDILDNLDRALEAAETAVVGEALIEGLILVRTQLLQTLQEEGLERIPVIGLPYDPNFSEAVETVLVEDPEHHHVVVKELMRGYRLNGKIARVSRVIVGEYPQPAAEVPPDAQDISPPPPPGPPVPPLALPGEPSLEEIVSKAEAQEALFPEGFSEDPEKTEKES
jgi:molecular chaperone GrpE